MPVDRTYIIRALELRRHMLAALGGGYEPAPLARVLGSVEPRVWSFVLRAEACALPLARALERTGVVNLLPASHVAMMRDAQLAEMQRVMAARSILLELDRVAFHLETHVTIIKGGVMATPTCSTPVDLGDVDAVADTDVAPDIWLELRRQGWTSNRGVEPSELRGRVVAAHYAPLRHPKLDFELELHENGSYRLAQDPPGLPADAPLPGYRHLARHTGLRGVERLLRHSVIKHPFRRGHLRDLALIASEIEQLSLAERKSLASNLRKDPYAPELAIMYQQSLAIANGEPVEDDSEQLRHVALKYLRLGGYGSVLRRGHQWATLNHLAIERTPIRRTAIVESMREAFQAVPAGSGFARLTEQAGLGKAALPAARVLRAAYHTIQLIASLALGVSTRRAVHSVTRGGR